MLMFTIQIKDILPIEVICEIINYRLSIPHKKNGLYHIACFSVLDVKDTPDQECPAIIYRRRILWNYGNDINYD